MAHLTLGLLRHGETDWNVASRLQGTSDIALNETGIAQAMTAAKAIDGSEWDLIIASPLSRARDTARIVAESNALGEITIEPLLMERAFGEAEGLNYHEWKKQHDAHQTVLGGESLPDLEARAHRLLAHLAKTYSGKRVLAVSHGALIRKVVRIVSNRELPRDGERFANTSLTKLAHREGAWHVEHYNPDALAAS
jgi:broad specificity phosphatase PhoE